MGKLSRAATARPICGQVGVLIFVHPSSKRVSIFLRHSMRYGRVVDKHHSYQRPQFTAT